MRVPTLVGGFRLCARSLAVKAPAPHRHPGPAAVGAYLQKGTYYVSFTVYYHILLVLRGGIGRPRAHGSRVAGLCMRDESGGVSRGVYGHSYLMYALYVSVNRFL